MRPLHLSSPAARGSFFYFVFFGALAAWIPFLNVYFHQLGLTGWQIGVLSAFLPAATFLLAAPLGALADRRGWRLGLLGVATAGMGLSLLLFVLPGGFWAFVPLMVLLAVFYSPATPLADSAVAGMAIRHRLNYGDMRLWGSLSFALMSIASGALWQRLGYRPMFILSAVVYLIVAWSTRGLEEARVVDAANRVPLRLVARDRFLIVFLAASFVIAAATGMDITFAGIYITHLGGNGLFVGLLFGISALCELPTMRYSGRIADAIGGPTCLLVAYGLFGIAYIGYALSPAPAVMLVFSGFRGLAYGLFYAGTIRLLSRRAPPEWASTLQGIMNALAMGLAQLIARPLAGGIYDNLGPSAVYVACTIAVGMAMLLMGSLAVRGRSARTQDVENDLAARRATGGR
jgi:PPP family 3-phenylpropionic acid transporter